MPKCMWQLTVAFTIFLFTPWANAATLTTMELLNQIDPEGDSAQIKVDARAVCDGATTYRESGLAPCKEKVNQAHYLDRKIFPFCASTQDADYRHACFRENRNRHFTEAEIASASMIYTGLHGLGSPVDSKLIQAAKVYQQQDAVAFCNTLDGQAKNLCKGTVFDNQDYGREIAFAALSGCAVIDNHDLRASCGQTVFNNSYHGGRDAACLEEDLSAMNPEEFIGCLTQLGKPWSSIDPGSGGGTYPGDPIGAPVPIEGRDGNGYCQLTPDRSQSATDDLKDLVWTLDNAITRNPEGPGRRVQVGSVLEAKVIAEALLEKLFLCKYGDLSHENASRISEETRRKRERIRRRIDQLEVSLPLTAFNTSWQ